MALCQFGDLTLYILYTQNTSRSIRVWRKKTDRRFIQTKNKNKSCKTMKPHTDPCHYRNVMRSADIIMMLPHTQNSNPHKPSHCSETGAPTVKQNKLFHYLSSHYGMNEAQQTAARLYGSVPHRACVNKRYLATGGQATHTAITVTCTGMVSEHCVCVCACVCVCMPTGYPLSLRVNLLP